MRYCKANELIFTRVLPSEERLLEMRCLFKKSDIDADKDFLRSWIIAFVSFLSGWICNEYTLECTRIKFFMMDANEDGATKYIER